MFPSRVTANHLTTACLPLHSVAFSSSLFVSTIFQQWFNNIKYQSLQSYNTRTINPVLLLLLQLLPAKHWQWSCWSWDHSARPRTVAAVVSHYCWLRRLSSAWAAERAVRQQLTDTWQRLWKLLTTQCTAAQLPSLCNCAQCNYDFLTHLTQLSAAALWATVQSPLTFCHEYITQGSNREQIMTVTIQTWEFWTCLLDKKSLPSYFCVKLSCSSLVLHVPLIVRVEWAF